MISRYCPALKAMSGKPLEEEVPEPAFYLHRTGKKKKYRSSRKPQPAPKKGVTETEVAPPPEEKPSPAPPAPAIIDKQTIEKRIQAVTVRLSKARIPQEDKQTLDAMIRRALDRALDQDYPAAQKFLDRIEKKLASY